MIITTSLLKLVDTVVGPVLCAALSKTQRVVETRTLADLDGPILVIRPGGIGDAVMLLPMLAALRERFPGRRVDILCEQRNRELFRLALPDDTHIMTYDRAPFASLRSLRRNRYAAVLDTEQFHNSSGIMTALTNAPLRIGFKINTHRRGLYTHLVGYDLDGLEHRQFARLLAAALGEETITLPQRAGILAHAQLPAIDRADLPRDYLVIHAGGSIPSKKWQSEHYAAICDFAHRELGLHTVVIGSTQDAATAAEIVSKAARVAESPHVINLCGALSLGQTAALCKNARALVGPDSGIAHLAGAVGTPAVVLFGPSDPNKWGPPADFGIALRNPLPCSPCSIFGYTKPCKNTQCITGITPARVQTALRNICTHTS